MRAIVVTAPGGPEALVPTEVPDPTPGPGQVLAEVAAVGVNFIDIYRRSGVYSVTYPSIPGTEGSGTVVALGEGVHNLAVGDRICWQDAHGSYAELVTVDANRAIVVPPGVDLRVAAAAPLQGLTAHYLGTSTHPIKPTDDVLIHAGAGGVGLLLTQIAAARGARVITTVGNDAKAELSREAGANDVIDYTAFDDITTELPALVRELTGGNGVDVVYDGVGRTTFDASLASLAVRGLLALFGGSSGQVPPFDLQRLNSAGSLYITRPTLGHYVRTDAELHSRAGELFGWIAAGTLRIRIGREFPLDEAAAAHGALESRGTTGKVLLIP